MLVTRKLTVALYFFPTMEVNGYYRQHGYQHSSNDTLDILIGFCCKKKGPLSNVNSVVSNEAQLTNTTNKQVSVGQRSKFT